MRVVRRVGEDKKITAGNKSQSLFFLHIGRKEIELSGEDMEKLLGMMTF